VGQTFNLGAGREISIGDLARLIASLIGQEVTIEGDTQRLRPDGSEVQRLLADSTRARTLLGWQPAVKLEEGLQYTIEWIRTHHATDRAVRYVV
jgi:nucleoside-diphosphate-sugar epimerase